MTDKQFFSLLAAAVLTLIPLCGESRFSLDARGEALWGAAAVLTAVPSLLIDTEPRERGTRSAVNPFDRPFTFSYSRGLDRAGTFFAASALVLPASCLLREEPRESWPVYGVMYAEAFALTTGSKELIKAAVSRNRPYSYTGDPLPGGDYHDSFPSGHTAYAFMSAGFLTAALLRDAPDWAGTKPLAAGAYGTALLVGGLRVASGEHFLSDVLAGALLGSLVGWAVPVLHDGGTADWALVPAARGLGAVYRY